VSLGGFGQVIQELQGTFINGNSNSFHIRKYISFLVNFNAFAFSLYWERIKVIK